MYEILFKDDYDHFCNLRVILLVVNNFVNFKDEIGNFFFFFVIAVLISKIIKDFIIICCDNMRGKSIQYIHAKI